uniref:Mucin-17-like n=1 Tax=Petromyzon marinus TaxID=7757 RepID=A0AAJ7TIY3_PETMA|nr:mucin-17-like [Petromyzon marinus]
MENIYSQIFGFQSTEIIEIINGSTVVDHRVTFQYSHSPDNSPDLNDLQNSIEKAFSNTTCILQDSITTSPEENCMGFYLDVNKTVTAADNTVVNGVADWCRYVQLSQYYEYFANGNTSECISECVVNHSKYHTCGPGTCQIHATGPVCECPDDFKGANCEEPVDSTNILLIIGIVMPLTLLLMVIVTIIVVVIKRHKRRRSRASGSGHYEKYSEGRDNPNYMAGDINDDFDYPLGALHPRLTKVSQEEITFKRPQVIEVAF